MASFWFFDHKLSPPTYARTDDRSPKPKFARINRLSTIEANIQMIAKGELVPGAAIEGSVCGILCNRWFTILYPAFGSGAGYLAGPYSLDVARSQQRAALSSLGSGGPPGLCSTVTTERQRIRKRE